MHLDIASKSNPKTLFGQHMKFYTTLEVDGTSHPAMYCFVMSFFFCEILFTWSTRLKRLSVSFSSKWSIIIKCPAKLTAKEPQQGKNLTDSPSTIISGSSFSMLSAICFFWESNAWVAGFTPSISRAKTFHGVWSVDVQFHEIETDRINKHLHILHSGFKLHQININQIYVHYQYSNWKTAEWNKRATKTLINSTLKKLKQPECSFPRRWRSLLEEATKSYGPNDEDLHSGIQGVIPRWIR